jgi:hypothetical protein
MRNYSTGVRGDSVVLVNITEPLYSEAYASAFRALSIAMEANCSFLNPSEEAVLGDFMGWALKVKQQHRDGVLVLEPCFVYANLNTGFTLVIVAANANGTPIL